MINTFELKLTCYSRNKKSLLMDNSLGIEIDYSDYEDDADILKHAERTMKKYMKFLHELHGDWATYDLCLKTDDGYDMEISFAYIDREYKIKTMCVNNAWTIIREENFHSSDTYIKIRNKVLNTIFNRIEEHIENNINESL